MFFRNFFYSACANVFENSSKFTFWVVFYGFIFIQSGAIVLEVKSNYLTHQVKSEGYNLVEGVVTGFKVDVNEKETRTESFYVNNVFFLHRSSKSKKGLFGYDNIKNKCTLIADGLQVRIYYVVDGSNNIIYSIQTAISDLC